MNSKYLKEALDMKKSTANFISLAIGLVLFMIMSFLFKMGIGGSLLFGVIAFFGSSIVIKRTVKQKEQSEGKTVEEYSKEIIHKGRKQVNRIRNLGYQIYGTDVRKDVESICETADEIFANLKADPSDMGAARKFLSYYLDTTEKILERYVNIKSKNINEPEFDETLNKTEEILKLIDKTFKEQMKKLLENDILDLDVELKVLEKTIKSEGV